MPDNSTTVVTIVMPAGYASAEEFCADCGFQRVPDDTREEIERLRIHVSRLEGHLTEKNRSIVRACDILTGRSYD